MKSRNFDCKKALYVCKLHAQLYVIVNLLTTNHGVYNAFCNHSFCSSSHCNILFNLNDSQFVNITLFFILNNKINVVIVLLYWTEC